MIIYGSNSSTLRTSTPKHLKCPHCGTEGSTSLNVFNHYAHVFWVPLFPLGRKTVSQCKNCQHVLKSKQMPVEFDADSRNLMSETRIPLWSFSGLALIAVFVAWVAYSSEQNSKATAEYLAAPLENDIYTIKTESDAYTTLKLIAVDDDSVTVAFNEYETNKKSGVGKIDKEENYEKESYRIARAYLVEMHQNKELVEIDRD